MACHDDGQVFSQGDQNPRDVHTPFSHAEIRLHLDPRAIVSDRCRRGPVVHEQPLRQELRVGWSVSGNLLLEHRARNLVEGAHSDGAAVGQCRYEEGQHLTRRDG